MKRIVLIAAAVLMMIPATGCDSKPGPKTFPKTETTASDATDEHAPNVGGEALKLGQTRKGENFDTTLEEVKFPYPPGEYRKPSDPTNDFLALRIQECMHKDAKAAEDGSTESSYNGEWAAITSDGYDYSGSGSSWNDWPSPKFPETVGMIPGRCIKGWIAFEIPKKAEISRIQFRPSGTPVAEWIP